MHVYHSMYFHYLLLYVIHMLLLDKLGDLLMYLSLSVTRCRRLDWGVASQLGNY